MVGWVGIWRAELFREGGMVGWLIKTAGEVWQNHPPGAESASRFGGRAGSCRMDGLGR